MIRTRLGSWHALFLAALGTAPFGCGGATSATDMSSASGGGGASGGSGGSDPGRATWSCTNPMPLTGVDTGYVRCAEGYTHRAKQVACPSIYPRSGSQLPADATFGAGPTGGGALATGGNTSGSWAAGGTGGVRFACAEDADCKEKPNGYCQYYPAVQALGAAGLCGPPSSPSRTVCSYGCVTDQDCGSGTICQCGEGIGSCVPSTCRTDADCGEGSLCAGGVYGESSIGFYSCQVPGDQCFTNSQCEGYPSRGGFCEWIGVNVDRIRTCVTRQVTLCGRPFCVDNVHRQASPTESASWLGSPIFVASADELDAVSRHEVASHYTEIALMEHASVAAFARFSLHLMSMGAPAWLLSETQRAMGDEIEHATACFALASSYAGSSVGPSQLCLEGAFAEVSMLEIVVTAVKEACFGETVAAIEAAEAASVATVPAVRELLSRISDDETRHAALGWRFLAWALENVGASTRAALEASLRELLHGECADADRQALSDTGFKAHAAALSAHGILSPASRAELRSTVLRDVVRPVLNSLLSAANSSETALVPEVAALS
ncbi:MAG: hypothetical protein SFV15_19995 [Polyangiaceae bacterium]|nr:hypothetical protein [Polyangiaceae bacterium]